MRHRLISCIILSLFICILVSVSYAYGEYATERKKAINQALDRIELSLEYGFAIQGTQIFEVYQDVDGDGDQERISRLEYPHRGGMLILKGEVGFWSKFFLGTRFGSSLFRRRKSIDQDWLMEFPPGSGTWWFSEDTVLLESESQSRPKVEFYDINLYYRVLDWDEEEIDRRRMASEASSIFDYLVTDSLFVDVFAGYQQQKGRYPMTDGVTTIYFATPVYAPFSNLDSFYKIRYRGPRLGLRAEGSKGKVATRLSFAYAWLETKAYGWWNLREYSFWQSGTEGYGVDIGVEVTYALTPSFSAGLGFNYFYLRQRRLKETGAYYSDPASDYSDLDIIRNANCKIYGPSFVLKYIW